MKWLSFTFQSLFAMTLITTGRAHAPLDPEKPLNQVPFVMSHDSASGYIEINEFFRPLQFKKEYSKSQRNTFKEQLDCGARAFDLRPAYSNSNIIFRSSFSPVDTITFQEGIQEILDWHSENQNELILLKISDCDGCNDNVKALLEGMNVSYIKDCSIFNLLTVAMTYELYGHVVAIPESCIVSNDADIGCHGISTDAETKDSILSCIPDGFEAMDDTEMLDQYSPIFDCIEENITTDQVSTYSCWLNDRTRSTPFGKLSNHLNNIVSNGAPSNGKLWQMPSHWQSSLESMIAGTFRPFPADYYFNLEASSKLEDAEKSRLNYLVLAYIRTLLSFEIPQTLNLVVVDDVCDDSAQELIYELRPYIEGDIQSRQTASPSASPTASLEPSGSPSEIPSGVPSGMPSLFPSGQPSDVPSGAPSGAPSLRPSSA